MFYLNHSQEVIVAPDYTRQVCSDEVLMAIAIPPKNYPCKHPNPYSPFSFPYVVSTDFVSYPDPA
jgi:hypothetical protein